MNNDEFKQLSAAARKANLLDYFQNSGYTVEKKGAERLKIGRASCRERV